MTTQDRYQSLLKVIPSGPYYSANGIVLPHRDRPSSFTLATGVHNTTFLISLNGVPSGHVTTDGDGNAACSVLLPLGEVTVELFPQGAPGKLTFFFTTKEWAVWLEAAAEQIAGVDTSVESTLSSFKLAEAGTQDIDLAHGVPLRTPNDSNADLETYREMLQLTRQAMRQFAGRTAGKRSVVASIAQTNPLLLFRRKYGPRWVLGFDKAPNGSLQQYTRYTTSPFTNLNASGAFITNDTFDQYNNTGSGATLSYEAEFHRLLWTPIGGSAAALFDVPDVSVSGVYTTPPFRIVADVQSVLTPPSVGSNRHLYVELDGHGVVDVWVSLGDSLSLTEVINGFLQTDRYNEYRIPSTQPAGSLVSGINVISVSSGTATGSATITYTGTAWQYASPGDSAGTAKVIASGATATLFSHNGVDSIQVLVSYLTPGATSDTFTVSEQYVTPVVQSGSNNQITVSSQNSSPSWGPSSVTIHDGPFSYGLGAFSLPLISASLSAGASAGATSVSVPNGTGALFNGRNGTAIVPFLAVVGRGANVASAASVTLTPVTDDTATVHITGGTFQPNDTHVVVATTRSNGYSRNDGAHKILSINAITNTATVSYGGLRANQPLVVTGVSMISVSPQVPNGGGSLQFLTGPDRLQWKSPTDGSYGTAVNVTAGGYFRLTSNTTSLGYIDVLVSVPDLPVGGQTETITIGKFTAQTLGAGDVVSVWTNGEQVTVTAVTPGTPEVWTLASPLIGGYSSGLMVYIPGQTVLHAQGKDDFGSITVNVNPAHAPVADATDTLTISGAPAPDGMYALGNTSGYSITPDSRFRVSALENTDAAHAKQLQFDLPIDVNLIGFKFTVKAWLRNIATDDVTTPTVTLGFNFGAGLVTQSGTMNTASATIREPQLFSFSKVLPPTATQFTINVAVSAGGFVIDRICLVQDNSTALFLGHNTIPRSDSRDSFGELLYVWCPDPLTSAESGLLGISAPVTGGKLLDVQNAHEQTDAFDVSDVVTGHVINVRGATYIADWAAATLVNMVSVSRTPDRFSYVKPSHVSQVTGEAIVPNVPSINKATLALVSNLDQTQATLYADGIPMPNDEWSFDGSSTPGVTSIIHVPGGFNPGSVYTIDYQLLIQMQTAAIDISSAGTNDTWFADYVVWNRHKSGVIGLTGTVSLVFGVDFTARLTVRSDLNMGTSVLIGDNGITQTIIPQTSWSYVDSLTVSINGSVFDPNSIYTLTYNRQLTDVSRVVAITSEVRSASTTLLLASATYRAFQINECVDATLRYHQIRLTLSGVIDTRDVRIHSALLKGLDFTTTLPPGFKA